jgi:heavy metal sensor kinase
LTLTTRLNLFFLSALAVVLAGFSAAIFLLARQHLHRQVEDHLDSALAVLTAGIEHAPTGLEWEPSDRQLQFRSGDDRAWVVTDPAGTAIDRGGPAETAEFVTAAAAALVHAGLDAKRLDGPGGRWEFRQLRIDHPSSYVPSAAAPAATTYPSLAITVGASLEPVRATLRRLVAALFGLSAVVLLAGLVGGRVVCRRALKPVTDMAQAAREMDASVLDRRLPVVANGDEVEGLARAFNDLLTRVQLAFDRQHRFAGEASHQLRTPLTALIGSVEVALRRDRPPEEYQRVLGAVRQQADRLQRIVEALLFLARADAEAELPQQEVIDLSRWVPEQLAGWTGHPRRADIAVEAAPGRVKVHPILLGELLNVLVDNALKYSAAGTTVTVRIAGSGGSVLLSVEDRGVGIAEEDRGRVFEPFFRAPAARLRGVEGLGLGLAVARRIASAFRGELTVESKPGEGSRFTLRLSEAAAGDG